MTFGLLIEFQIQPIRERALFDQASFQARRAAEFRRLSKASTSATTP
jgi:hypothetical protein